ncbi:hypothetical protein MMC25_004273 [Agyrium rufum]|nr:hypothetical protein [Agyrium rufum]
MPKKAAAENTKKVAGNVKKAEAAAQKAAVQQSKVAATEDEQWSKGAKSSAKKEAEESKKAEQARKKAEKDALLREEEASQPSKPKGTGTKTAVKKTNAAPSRGLDLSQLDDAPPFNSLSSNALNATGIDSALDALDLTSGKMSTAAVDRHPERRFKAAYAVYEARRMPELEVESKGLRRQQRIEVIRKEFEKSEENPFNQVTVDYDASRDEVKEAREKEAGKVEKRLGGA